MIEDFERFYREHYGLVYRLVWALAGPDVADDLTQEAFLRAHRRWDSVSGYQDPVGWVRRVARNLAISRYRRLLAEARALVRSGPPRTVDLSAPSVEVWEAVRQLSTRQRQVVVLCLLEGYSRAETATELGISIETVKTHLERARAALAARLEET